MATLDGRQYEPIRLAAPLPEHLLGVPSPVVANGRAAKVIGYRVSVVVEYDSGGGRETIPLVDEHEVYYHPAMIDEDRGGWFRGGRR